MHCWGRVESCSIHGNGVLIVCYIFASWWHSRIAMIGQLIYYVAIKNAFNSEILLFHLMCSKWSTWSGGVVFLDNSLQKCTCLWVFQCFSLSVSQRWGSAILSYAFMTDTFSRVALNAMAGTRKSLNCTGFCQTVGLCLYLCPSFIQTHWTRGMMMNPSLENACWCYPVFMSWLLINVAQCVTVAVWRQVLSFIFLSDFLLINF